MRFSIIVPVYNVEKYLSKCLDSILVQDYTDYELIIVDDGGSDSSYEIAISYKERFPDKVQIVRQENKGLGGARNTGIDNAKGEYLFFVDSDDYIEKDSLKILDGAVTEYESDIIMFNYHKVDEQGNIIWTHSYREYFCNDNLENYPRLLLEIPSACTKVFKRELFDNIRFPEKQLYEDFAIYGILLNEADSISVINECLYYYVQRSNSIMRGTDISRYKEIIYGLDNIIKYYEEKDIKDKYIEELRYIAIVNVVLLRVVPMLYNNPCHKDASKILAYLKAHLGEWIDSRYMRERPECDLIFARKVYTGHFYRIYLKEKINNLLRKRN